MQHTANIVRQRKNEELIRLCGFVHMQKKGFLMTRLIYHNNIMYSFDYLSILSKGRQAIFVIIINNKRYHYHRVFECSQCACINIYLCPPNVAFAPLCLAYAPIKDSDRPGHTPSLVQVFAVRSRDGLGSKPEFLVVILTSIIHTINV